MKAETLASLYSSLCLGICVGSGPEVGEGFAEAEKGLCIAALDISASSRPAWESHPHELPLSDCMVYTKCVFTGHALASRRLKEMKFWSQASEPVFWMLLNTWLSHELPLYSLLCLKLAEQLAGPFKNE